VRTEHFLLLTGLIGLATAMVPLYREIRRTRTELRGSIADVHVIVNRQRSDMQRYQAALVEALREAGVAVPADESLQPKEPPS